MTIATGNFAELLWPGIHDIWGHAYNDYEPLYKKVYEVKKSDKTFEKEQGVTGMPLASVKQQGQSVNYVDPYQGYQREYVNVTYAIGGTVTKEMFTDEQYGYINKLPAMLARSMRQTEETLGWNQFNNGFSTAVSADGLSILNSAHTLVAGGTFSNILATPADLTQTSLETLSAQILDAVDDQGLRIRLLPRALVVATANNYTARKLMESPNVVGKADNDINPMMGQFRDVIVSPWLTDADAWFIVTDCDNGMVWYQRWAAELERDNEFDTKNLKFTLTNRFSLGNTDPRGVYGTAGA